jgi:hypothetical protein
VAVWQVVFSAELFLQRMVADNADICAISNYDVQLLEVRRRERERERERESERERERAKRVVPGAYGR